MWLKSTSLEVNSTYFLFNYPVAYMIHKSLERLIVCHKVYHLCEPHFKAPAGCV